MEGGGGGGGGAAPALSLLSCCPHAARAPSPRPPFAILAGGGRACLLPLPPVPPLIHQRPLPCLSPPPPRRTPGAAPGGPRPPLCAHRHTGAVRALSGGCVFPGGARVVVRCGACFIFPPFIPPLPLFLRPINPPSPHVLSFTFASSPLVPLADGEGEGEGEGGRTHACAHTHACCPRCLAPRLPLPFPLAAYGGVRRGWWGCVRGRVLCSFPLSSSPFLFSPSVRACVCVFWRREGGGNRVGMGTDHEKRAGGAILPPPTYV